MDDPCLEAGGGQGALDRPVIMTGLFDGGDEIVDLMGGDGLTQLGHRRFEALAGVFDLGLFDQDAAVEIGEHPFGAGLGTIGGNDAKVLRSDLLDPG